MPTLDQLFAHSAASWPERVAVEEADGTAMTYRELDRLSRRVCLELQHLGVRANDRVGIWLGKSIDAVAAILGVLRAGAAYVPVDATAPAERSLAILVDCSVRAAIVEETVAETLPASAAASIPSLVRVDKPGGGRGLMCGLSWRPESPAEIPAADDGDRLACLLYTSGSTGLPKGVMLSHRNVTSFVDWCSAIFQPVETERFASHAPLHFDLSILDLFLSLRHGARAVLLDETVVQNPRRVAEVLARRRISILYSVPSALTLLARYGSLERSDLTALRLILFAGEVFPIRHLSQLMRLVPGPRYFNLYGPTETNVCTYHELPGAVGAERTEPLPIGRACEHLQVMLVDAAGRPVDAASEGELWVSGPAVMRGYWNRPDDNARAFVTRAGSRWYRTGDVGRRDADGNFVFIGRRDRQVKRRGFRIELGEIEAGLHRHPAVAEAAVVAVHDEDSGVTICAFLDCPQERPGIIEMRRFCTSVLPAWMTPDRFAFVAPIPRTSTGKIDYSTLTARWHQMQ